MGLMDIINRVAKKPNYDETSDMGALETFDPAYSRTKPDWESGVAPSQSEQSIAEDGVEMVTPTGEKNAKRKPLSAQDNNALRNDESKDKKKKEIEKLLSDYDKATAKRKSSNIAAGLSEAGMEFGQAFGGKPVDKEFINGVRSRGESDKNDFLAKNKLDVDRRGEFRDQGNYDQKQMMNAQSMDNTNLDMEKKTDSLENEDSMLNNQSEESNMARQIAADMGIEVPKTASARDITNVLPFVKERMSEKKATQHELASTKRVGIQQFHADKRAKEGNATGVAKSLIAAGQKESVHGLRQDEANRKIAERMIKGKRFHNMAAGEIPSANDAKEVKDMQSAWVPLKQIQSEVISMLERNPRNFIGSDAWSKMQSSWVDQANLRNHVNKNGVMNFNDWETLKQNMGDPTSLKQWILGDGLERMKTSLRNGEIRRVEFDAAHGYEDGDMSLGQSPHSYSGGQMSKSGNTLQPTQEALGTMLDAANLPQVKMKTATENGPKAPVQEPSPSHGRVVKTVTNKAGTTFILYEDGFREKR